MHRFLSSQNCGCIWWGGSFIPWGCETHRVSRFIEWHQVTLWRWEFSRPEVPWAFAQAPGPGTSAGSPVTDTEPLSILGYPGTFVPQPSDQGSAEDTEEGVCLGWGPVIAVGIPGVQDGDTLPGPGQT